MRVTDLHFHYPDDLVAIEPQEPCRVLVSRPNTSPQEIDRSQLLGLFQAGDVIVRNDTRVAQRRIFLETGLEILFVQKISDLEWEVLLPARELKIGEPVALPGGLTLALKAKGLPQIATLSHPLTEEYFAQHGQLALPPYIQKARGERRPRTEDQQWYQTEWSKVSGSSAAPTASLHFRESDFNDVRARGVHVEDLTLHVGLGTYLPVKTERLEDHVMHAESVLIPARTIEQIRMAQREGRKVWALGTTVARALESLAQGVLKLDSEGNAAGESQIFIYPGHSWTYVDGLITNFHQPQSTLLALVAAFAGLETTLQAYRYAVEQRFRLFSYGDVSVWLRN